MAFGRKMKAKAGKSSEFLVPPDEKQLLEWLEKKRSTGSPRMPDIQMKMNLAYVLGQQNIVWDSGRKMFLRPEQNPDDPNAPIRLPINKIAGIMEHFIARLTKNAPEPQARPVTDDDNDVGAAKAATRILLHELDRLDWEVIVVLLYFWVVPLGWAFLQVTWDPEAGDLAGTIDGENGEDPEELMEGEIDLDIVPAFELAIDPNAMSMHQAKWACRTKSMTREAVWETYGVEVPASKDGSAERSLVDDVYSLMDAGSPQGDASNTVRVHQMWMKPCRAAPDGLVVTWCGSTILDPSKPFPYHHGRLPFVEWDLLPGIGNREGRTWVTDMLPMQADYNDARSREASLRRTLVPKFTAPIGSIDRRRIGTRADIIEYAPVGEKPSWDIPDSGWMAQHENSMNRADMEMGDRAGQSDVSSGKPASASMPAAAILALQEADDTKLAVTAKLLARSVKETGWQILQLVRQYWTEDRKVRTWSEAGTLEVKQFNGSDVEKQLDIHVESESALPRSKSARVQLAMDLLAIGPPGTPMSPFNDWRDVFRLMDVPGTDFMVQSLSGPAKQATRENDDLLQGVVRKVELWHNHLSHIAEHERERCGETYDAIARRAEAGDPEAIQIKAGYDAHVMAHYEMYGAQQMGLQQPAPAGPPEGAEGEAPPGTDTTPNDPAQQEYLDPLTGKPPDPLAVAAGQQPSALANSTVGQRAGIGGAGQPGRVPGISADQQAASMGA